MSSPRRYPPPSLRYLKARLWTLTRPSFWGTAIFLSVVGLFIRQYWTNPNFFFTVRTQDPENTKPLESFLSEEEKAIAADIDNLPVLLYESRQQNLSTTASKLKKKTQVNREQALFENLVKQRNTVQKRIRYNYGVTKQQNILTPKVENPFLQQANKLLELNNFASSKQLLQVEPSNTTSSVSLITTSLLDSRMLYSAPSNSLENLTPKNALQTALNQLENKNQQQQQILPQLSLQNNIASPIVPSNQLPNFYSNINNPSLPVNYSTPTTAIGRLQNLDTNPTVPQRFVNNSSQINIQTNIQTNIRNVPPNSYNNYVNTAQSVNVNPVRQLNIPVNSGVANNIRSNTLQNPRQTVIAPNTSVAPNNYNPNLQSPYQEPNTLTNYNYSTPRQVPQQTNGYSYP